MGKRLDLLLGSSRLAAASICLALAILLVSIFAWWEDRQDIWSSETTSLQSVRIALANDIDRTLQQFDLSLRGTIERLRTPELELLSPQSRQNLLFDRSADAEYLEAILVADADGKVTYDSRYAELASTRQIGDRRYFQVHRDPTSPRLYVSAPFDGRIERVGNVIALSRRLSDQDGHFAGVVVGFLQQSYLEDRFRDLRLGNQGVSLLVKTDGIILMRDPDSNLYTGKDISTSPVFQSYEIRREGSFPAPSALDGTVRLYSFQRVGSFPLILNIGMSVSDLLAPSNRKAILFGPILIFLCGSAVVLALLFQAELRRRAQAEAVLSALAATDPLTGLPNRRTFDALIDVEWRSSARSGESFAVLFIDVDHFKLVNDRYGHDIGDRVLKMIAQIIEASIRRPRDKAARYGGEEFVVILPETNLDGALGIAETIRSALRKMRVAGVGQQVTVSIGIACHVAENEARPPALLLAAADEALYQAKHKGRDRVEVARSIAAARVPKAGAAESVG